MSGLGRAAKYSLLLPSMLILSAQLALAILESKFKQSRAVGHFRKGLLSSGISKGEAERIARACFDGDA